MEDKIIYALDIGTSKVAALAAKKNNNGKVEILGMGVSKSFGVKRGVVSNIDKTVHAIRKAISEAEAQSGLTFSGVQVGIAGDHIKSLQHRGILTRNDVDIEISQSDIDRLKQDMYKLSLPPGDSIIHVLPQEYIVDNEQGVIEPVGMAGIRLEGNFHIITGKKTAIHNINKCVLKSNYTIDNIVLEPLASSAAVLSKEELEAGVALVDIGGGTTDLAVFEDGIIRHTHVIPFGGDIITEDIKKGCMILRDQAESLKVKFGTALASDSQEKEVVSIPGLRGGNHKEITIKNLSSIIQARMMEILEHVHFELRGKGFDKRLIGGIVLTGGGSQLSHIVQLTELITGMTARIGIPNEHLAPTKLKQVDNPIFATGIGLAIRAFSELDKIENGEEGEPTVNSIINKAMTVEAIGEKEKIDIEDFIKEDNEEEKVDEDLKDVENRPGIFRRMIDKSVKWLGEGIEGDFHDTK